MTSPTVTAFTDGPAVKAYLRIGLANTDDDGAIRALADAANVAIAKSLQRNVMTASYSETRDGTGTPTLMLLNFPVTAVASAQFVGPVPGGVVNTQTLVAGQDYTFTKFALKMYRGRWPKGIQNILINYTAGYQSMPSDLTHAATKVAALRYRELERLGQKSKIIANENITFDLSEFPPDVIGILDRYRVGMALTDELAGTQ